MKARNILVLFVGTLFSLSAMAASGEADENASEKERQKYQSLMTMKDQSEETYYEQTRKISIVAGAASIFANPGTGIGIQRTAFSGGLEYSSQVFEEFELGGYLGITSEYSGFFPAKTLLIPFGVLANYYLHESFYIGARMGLLVRTMSGFPTLDFTFGPQLGTDFRIAEGISIGAEFYVPFVSGVPSFALFNYTAHLRFWI